MRTHTGFTLVELLIAVAIVGILASVLLMSLNGSTAQARDAERQADLRALQSAVELYKLKYGRYPAGCRDTTSSWTGNWSGQAGSGYQCASGNQYIVGLAPEFIPVLPTDPKLNPAFANSGYVYTTNPEGTVYKIMALNTVETEVVQIGIGIGIDPHPMSRCGDMGSSFAECAAVPANPTGIQAYNTVGSTPFHCQASNQSEWGNDYAVYGGFAPGGNWPYVGGSYRDSERAREHYSDQIRCK